MANERKYGSHITFEEGRSVKIGERITYDENGKVVSREKDVHAFEGERRQIVGVNAEEFAIGAREFLRAITGIGSTDPNARGRLFDNRKQAIGKDGKVYRFADYGTSLSDLLLPAPKRKG